MKQALYFIRSVESINLFYAVLADGDKRRKTYRDWKNNVVDPVELWKLLTAFNCDIEIIADGYKSAVTVPKGQLHAFEYELNNRLNWRG